MTSALSKFDHQRLARIEQWAKALVSDEKLPGVGLVIKVAGQEVFATFQGWADVEVQKPFVRDTLARIYSMTKPITSLAIMQLVERGQLTFDAPVSRFLPEFANMTALAPGAERIEDVVPARTPTIHELLVHTSGLTYSFNSGLVSSQMTSERLLFAPKSGTLEDQCRALARLPLAFEPGSRWEYGVGIDVAGRVVEVVAGQSLADYFDQHILTPLGMNETSFQVRASQAKRFASLYMPQHDPVDGYQPPGLRRIERPERSHFNQPQMYSGGSGLVGTIDDYMRFVEALRLRGRTPDAGAAVLAPRSVDFMMQNHLPGDIVDLGPRSFAEQPTSGTGFGLGGAVVTSPARMTVPGNVGDYSWGGMASTFFWLDRVLDMSVVFFTQLTPSGAYPIRAELKALVHAAMAD